jgi:hypothetical protein
MAKRNFCSGMCKKLLTCTDRPPFGRYLADHNRGKKAIKSKNSKDAYVMHLRAPVIDKKSARGAFFSMKGEHLHLAASVMSHRDRLEFRIKAAAASHCI